MYVCVPIHSVFAPHIDWIRVPVKKTQEHSCFSAPDSVTFGVGAPAEATTRTSHTPLRHSLPNGRQTPATSFPPPCL
eukprot:COSAG01_NODE_55087_length_327_cov_1.140351_1_plen_76_part_01